MELTHLRHFFHVARTQSFVVGAKLSHVSPPAISKSVSRLEEELGARLFERTTRRVVLTESGRLLLERCLRIFEEVDSIRRDLDEVNVAMSGELRIAAMEIFSIYLLPTALARLVNKHPLVTPLTFEMLPNLMEQSLREGRLDVGFTVGGGDSKDVTYTTLGTSAGCFVCGRKHALYAAGQIDEASIERYPFVVPRFFDREYLPVLDQFPEDRLSRRVGATIELLQMGIQLAIAGAYLGYFPEISIGHHLKSGALRRLIGVRPGRPFELRVLTRSGALPRAAVTALTEELRRILPGQ